MATPTGFEGANQIFQGNGGDVRDLETYNNGRVTISCWRFTPEEIEHINRTGVAWVTVFMGKQMPPIYLSGEPLTATDGHELRVEPEMPRPPVKRDYDQC